MSWTMHDSRVLIDSNSAVDEVASYISRYVDTANDYIVWTFGFKMYLDHDVMATL